jgi:tetratricopeptide (TPR) repeat protein/DNA-binding XRE family transcriptional regulator
VGGRQRPEGLGGDEAPVAEGPARSFGPLLRQLRVDAGLTQEELADAATISPRSVSDLERGINATARKETARLLADALGLAGPQRAQFEAIARGREPAASSGGNAPSSPGALGGPAAATRTLPRDISGFTGRTAELARLTAALAGAAPGGGVVGIHAIGGMAGIGKTTMAVHAAHRLAPDFPDGQIFLPLHVHTPGQRPVDPADALASLLLAAGIGAQAIPAGPEARAGCWRDYLAGKKVLLILDDATGHEQVRPLLPGTAGSLVLITSRRRLTALEDAAVISLDTLPPDEASELMVRLAGRPDTRPGDEGIAEIIRLCGYLPLAIGMLARQLHHHPAWTPAGLAAELAVARDRLELMHAENLSVAAAFNLSYEDLTAGQRHLFRRLGLHPGPDIDPTAPPPWMAPAWPPSGGTWRLYDQHLISEPAPGRFRLHDLLREHAQTLAANDGPADREAATGRLLDYYLHTALAASKQVPSANWSPAVVSLPSAQPPKCAPQISTSGQAAAWLEDERANLHAAVGFAAANELPRHAMLIPAAMAGFLSVRHYRDQALALDETALAAARQAGDRPGEGRALNLLASSQIGADDFAAADATLQQPLALHRDLGDQGGQADALNGLGAVRCLTGDYPAAETSHQQALALFRVIGHMHGQSEALTHLAVVQRLTGDYPAAEASLRLAEDRNLDLGDRYKQAWTRSELAMLQQLMGDYPAAEASHEQALRLYRDLGQRREQAEVLNSLGELSSRCAAGQQACHYYNQALTIAREVGAPLEEARALEGLGRCHLQDGHTREGTAHLQQALTIYQRIGAPSVRRVQQALLGHRPTMP